MNLGRLLQGLALRLVLDRIAGPGAAATPGPTARARRPGLPRSPLFVVMMGSFVVGAGLIVIFESTLLRVLGAAICLVFVVAGVFVIADPEFLEQEDG